MSIAKCEKCGLAKEMYYNLWCPSCEVPQPDKKNVMNFIKAIDHIQAKYFPETKDDYLNKQSRNFWGYFGERIPHNDMYVEIDFAKELQYYPDDKFYKEDVHEFFKKFVEVYNLKKNSDYLWWVSW